MEQNDFTEGELAFDETTGKFWIVKEEMGLKSIDFGDSFEVKVDDNWVRTSIEIANNEDGDLIFKLKNTPYQGIVDGVEARI